MMTAVKRTWPVTGALLLAASGWATAACGPDAAPSATASTSPASPAPTTAPSPAPTPLTPPTEQPGGPTAELAGDWSNKQIGWTLHLRADGSYTEDFEGQPEISGGTYTLEGSQIILRGEPVTSRGRYDGTTLTFDEYVLTRS